MKDLELMEHALHALHGLLAQPAGATAQDACMFQALAAADSLHRRLARPAQYLRDNPLGGPAKVFDAMADAIRAGDDYHQTLARFNYTEVHGDCDMGELCIGCIPRRPDGSCPSAPPQRQPLPGDWSVFNSGAEVASGLTFEEAWDYMTPERLERGWSAVCVVNKDNLPLDAPPQRQPLTEWIAVEQQLPKPGEHVLAVFRYSSGSQRVIRAMHAPHHTLSEDDWGEFITGADYDEATDTTYWPEGWYECNENEETHWHVTEEVTHWMPLPAPPAAHGIGGKA